MDIIYIYIYIYIYVISAHLYYIPDNSIDYSEEQGGCFNQDMLTMEYRYHEHVNINILYEYCWRLYTKKGYKILK